MSSEPRSHYPETAPFETGIRATDRFAGRVAHV